MRQGRQARGIRFRLEQLESRLLLSSVYVSDLPYTAVTNGWGPVEKDMSNGEQGAGDGHTITLNGVTYAKGLGVHATSEVDVTLNGNYASFATDVGIDDEVGTNGNVDFKVVADGATLFDSGAMTGTSSTQHVNVNVAGKALLKLIVNPVGSGNAYDHADWAGAQLTTAAASAPATPSNFHTTASTTSSISLAWNDVSNESGFKVLRSTSAAGPFAVVNPTGAPQTTVGTGVLTYTDTGLAAGTPYYYELIASNATGDSAATAPLSAATQAVAGSVYVSDLPYTAVTNGWGPVEKDMSNGEQASGDGHTITLNGVTYAKGLGVHATSEVDVNLAGNYTTFTSDVGVDDEVGSNGNVDFQIVADGATLFDSGAMTGASVTQHASVNVTGKAILKLIVNPVGSGNAYDHADWAGARLSTAAPSAPATPANFHATGSTSSSISLAWNDVANESGFKILRATIAAGPFAVINPTGTLQTTVGTGVLTYTDTGLAASNTYYYELVASNSVGDSAATAAISATTQAQLSAPATPANFAATALSSSQIKLTWSDVSTEAGFKVLRSTSVGGPFATLAPSGSLNTTVGTGVLTYTDTGLAAGSTYYYELIASNAAGDSAATSPAISATTQASTGTTVFVSDLPYTAVTNGWGPVEKDMSNGEQPAGDGHTITLNGVTYAKGLGTHALSEVDLNLAGNYTTFTSDVGVDDEVGSNGNVDFQIIADGATLYDSGAMTGTSATQHVNVNVTGKSLLKLIVNPVGSGNAYDHADWAGAQLVTNGTVSTIPAAPANLHVTGGTASTISLAWNDVANEVGFKVSRTTDGVLWTEVGPVLGAGVTAFTDRTLLADVTYTYRVQAVGTGGDSAVSGAATATTQAIGQQSFAVDAGDDASGYFLQDAYFVGGNTFISSATISTTGVTNPAPQRVYQSERNGNFSYVAAGLTPGTSYTVRLHFAEIFWQNAGQRVFNVSINGTQVLTNFDIIAATGAEFRAVVQQFTTTVDAGGKVTVSFTGVKDSAKVSGIEFIANAGQLPPAVGNLSATAVNSGAQVTLTWSTPAANVYKYTIERSTDKVNFTQIAQLAYNATSYNDITATPATQYWYRVKATNGAGDSPYSNVANVTTATPAYTWTTEAPAPITLAEAQSAVVNGKFYVFGGFYNPQIQATTQSEVFDPAKNTWTALPAMPEALTHSGVVVDGSTIYFVGGFVGNSPYATTNHVWKFNTVTNTWSAGVSLPVVRAAGGCTIIGRSMHYFGGLGADTSTGVADHYVFNLDTGTSWTTAAPLPGPRDHMAGVAINGRAYAVGGQTDRFDADENSAEIDVYDPAFNTWTRLTDLPIPLGHIIPAVNVFHNHIVVTGGETNVAVISAAVFSYDPLTNTWISLPNMPGPRHSDVSGFIGNQLIVATGSTTPATDGVTNTTWLSSPITIF